MNYKPPLKDRTTEELNESLENMISIGRKSPYYGQAHLSIISIKEELSKRLVVEKPADKGE